MSERFFAAEPISAKRVTLDGPEAHHLLHVMRAAIGQHVTLFDDSGAEFLAMVDSLGRSSARLQILERNEISRELPYSLDVGVALPKGDRQKWLIEKLAELGTTTVVPLTTEHGVAQPVAGALERLRRSVIEASKQCGRNRLLKIHEPQHWQQWILQPYELSNESHIPSNIQPSDARRLVAHPGGKLLSEFDLTPPMPTQVAVGPEGGLTDAEIEIAIDAGWLAVDLGPRILRVETAAVAMAAAIVLAAKSGASNPT